MEMDEEQKFCLHIRREGKNSMKAERNCLLLIQPAVVQPALY